MLAGLRRASLVLRPSEANAAQVCFFLGRALVEPQIRRATATSRTRTAHLVHVTHRDEVEPPLTTWLREAYETSPALSGTRAAARTPRRSRVSR